MKYNKSRNYQMLIFNNNIYIYDKLSDIMKKIKINGDYIYDDKIVNYKQFYDELLKIDIIKKVKKSISSDTIIYNCWENFDESNKLVITSVFNNLNFSNVIFENIKDKISLIMPILFLSGDGIHYVDNNSFYYKYNSFLKSIQLTIQEIKKIYKLKQYIIVSDSIIDTDAYTFEDNDNLFCEILKM